MDSILERRTFKMLPDSDLGFSKPAVEYTTGDGQTRIKVSHTYKAPEPEMARKAADPGYWTVTVNLPVGAQPLRLVPDPSALTL